MDSEGSEEEDREEQVEVEEKKRPLVLGLTYAPPIESEEEE